MDRQGGSPIILTADRLLMADYACLFDAMVAASQTTTTPRLILESLLMPPPRSNSIEAANAPLGLRRIESALHAAGIEAMVVHPDRLQDAIGRDTRIVGIATGEPLGKGMNSSTMVAIAGGRIWAQVFFDQVYSKVKMLAPHASIAIGGPGAWQIAQTHPTNLTVVDGYCEGNIASIFREMLGTRQPLGTVKGDYTADIPKIRGASSIGAIEMSRGCGLGCEFCTIARTPMTHMPLDTILSDVDVNIRGSQKNLSLLSEDFFRYGAQGMRVNPAGLIEILRQIRENQAIKLLQIDHVNVSSIAQFSDEELREVHRLLTLGQRHEFLWVNIGIETASGELLIRNGGKSKMAGCRPDDWYDFTQEQIRRLMRAGFYPLVSLVLGLSHEDPRDAELNLRWVQELKNQRMSVFPVALAPLGKYHSPPQLNRIHWKTVIESYRLNFKWAPKLVWDNERGAGAPIARSIAAQLIGKTQVLWWNASFRLRKRKADG
jgi:radical SAM superfamily enzyme YgiQ (UPF0313 family)